MSRSRLVVLVATVFVATGFLLALGALLVDPARAAVGPMPADGLTLPADTRVVMGFDVQRFVASPFYAKFAGRQAAGHPQAFKDLEEKTGLNPERDLDRVVVATRGSGPQSESVVLVSGRFDRYKLMRALETDGRRGLTWKKHEGLTVYVYDEGKGRTANAVAFLEDDLVALGPVAQVEAVIDSRARGQRPLEGNPGLIALLGRVKPGSAFWMVGDQTALAQMPTSVPGPGGTGSQVTLPSLKSVVVEGEFDPVLSLQVTGEAADAPAAQNLADVVRGLVAMANLQAAQKPEFKALASAVSVTTEASLVHVGVRLPYDVLDRLQAASKPAAAPAASPAAPGVR